MRVFLLRTRMPQQQSIARFFGSAAVKRKPFGQNGSDATPDSAPVKIARTDTKADAKTDTRRDTFDSLRNGVRKMENLKMEKVNLEKEHKGEVLSKGEVPEDQKVDQKEKKGGQRDGEKVGEKASEGKDDRVEESVAKENVAKESASAANVGAAKNVSLSYSKLTSVFEQIEQESSRLKITSIISSFFHEILETCPDRLTKVVYLFINRLGPDYEPDLELGLGESLLIKAISECYGRPVAQIKKDYHELGDLGLVAQKSRSGQPTMFKPAALDVDTVFANLTSIAKSTGKDSQAKKIGLINRMLTACDMKSSEAKFLVRSLEGKLRIGLAEKTVLVGLAQAFEEYEKKGVKRRASEEASSTEDIIREAFSQIPNYSVIIDHAYRHGIRNLLDHCQLRPGIPLKPMLAKPTKSISEVLDRFQGEEFTCEYKYDGERAQIHLLEDGSVRIYSRNSEDMSQRYPDLIGIIKDFLHEQDKMPSFILDCEVVAWDAVSNKILPFQVLSTRKRKDVAEKDIKVQICVFAFDMLFFNGSLITKSLAERRQAMESSFKPVHGKFQFATAKNSSNLDELQIFLDQSVSDSCEGLMVKMLNGKESYYEPSKRSRNWLKLKKDYLAGVGDSLDLVVVGGYKGKGKRTGFYGGFLLASYNQDTGEYETTCKIGTGFSEEMLASLHAKLKETEIEAPKKYVVYDSNTKPDVWFEPTTVFEVLTADLSLSPVYKAAHQTYGKGISLRFPRFIRVREDKGVEDATSSEQVVEFYERQANIN